MKFLLDVNVLLAAIWVDHSHHELVSRWPVGKPLIVCPLSELGFLRISTNPRVIGASMNNARHLFERFLSERKVERIPDDLPALASRPSSSAQVTDHYLADLATKHGIRFGTLDMNLNHPAVERIR